jgi:hypothetical protein
MAGNKKSRRSFLKDASLAGAGVSAAFPCRSQAFLPKISSSGEPEFRNYKPEIMNYRRLGKTNVMVSEIGLGGATNYGADKNLSATANPTEFREMLERLLDLGVNYFDTLRELPDTADPAYDTDGKYAFLCTQENRDKVIISTKSDMRDPASFKTALEESLQVMDTDYIDIMMLHLENGVSGSDYSAAMRLFDACDEMKDEGKIRFAGMSAHHAGVLGGLIANYTERVDVILG